MKFGELVKHGYLVYSKMHSQGYPAEGFEVRIDGDDVRSFEDSDTVRIYNYDEEVVLELDDWDCEIDVPVHVFKVTREVVL